MQKIFDWKWQFVPRDTDDQQKMVSGDYSGLSPLCLIVTVVENYWKRHQWSNRRRTFLKSCEYLEYLEFFSFFRSHLNSTCFKNGKNCVLCSDEFLVLELLSATEIFTKIMSVLKKSAVTFPTKHRWVWEMNHLWTTKTATTQEIIKQIHKIQVWLIVKWWRQTNSPYFTWRITYEEADWKVSDAFDNNSTKTDMWANFLATFESF